MVGISRGTMVFRILDRTQWSEFLTAVGITDRPRWSGIPNGRRLLGFSNDRQWSEIPDSQLLTMDSCWELLMIVKNSRISTNISGWQFPMSFQQMFPKDKPIRNSRGVAYFLLLYDYVFRK